MTQAPAEAPAGEDAFDRLLRERSGALLRTAYLLTGDRQLAEDLLQTALTKTYLRWGRLRDVQAGEAYVRRVMATTYSSWWRRRWNDEHPTGTPPEEVAPDAYGAADDRDVLRRALAGLSKRQRAMVVMRFYGDLSETETADAMGVSVGTVKSTVARALARLRETAPPSLFSRPTVVRIDEPVTQRTATP
ncbi:MAG: polymerase sigma-70 factor, subfamily [Actinomycetota bacterium]|nr:polymerase sigma-70 factor, subfamily [Actinomycetota bacterium]